MFEQPQRSEEAGRAGTDDEDWLAIRTGLAGKDRRARQVGFPKADFRMIYNISPAAVKGAACYTE